MTVEKRLKLIKKDTTEILTEEELKKLLEEKKKPVVYHGFEPTGETIHIGYIIGVNKLIDFQKAGLKVITLFADLHAWLNEKGSLEKIRKVAQLYNLSFEALGLDTKKSQAVLGSTFQLKKDYFQDVLKLSLRTRLLRAKRAMTIIGREEENPHVAQLFYPLMQAIDIKALKVDIAFGDEAQRKIHVLAREELPHLGCKAPICIHHIDMVGLTGEKMSSSIPATHIKIDEKPEGIKEKIKNSFCPAKQLENNPILQICEYIIFKKLSTLEIERPAKYGGNLVINSYQELKEHYQRGELHPLDLKNGVAQALIKILEPVRKFMTKPKVTKLKEEIKKLT